GLKLGYYAQEHETLDPDRTVLENMRSAAPDLDLVEVRKTLGSPCVAGTLMQGISRTAPSVTRPGGRPAPPAPGGCRRPGRSPAW
ncbi:hypothetical protein CLM85_08510, partial [Streptomyces albidoflavus]